MTPPLPDDSAASSPLATLRQLKEMLDAGAITQQEFDALKQQLIFGAAASAPVPATPAPLPPPPTPYLDGPAALTPEATPLLAPEPDWQAAPVPPLVPAEPEADDSDEPAAERRNPLNLVFAIGGLLLFLGAMAYLTLFRTPAPDEHLTSTTQTAADSLAAPPEEGPQVEQLTLPPAAAPETLRVAPALPPPVAPATAAADSVPAASAAAATTPAPAPAAAKATTPKPAAPKPAATPAPADTASTAP